MFCLGTQDSCIGSCCSWSWAEAQEVWHIPMESR